MDFKKSATELLNYDRRKAVPSIKQITALDIATSMPRNLLPLSRN